MPEINHAMRSAAQEPRTEHNVGTILQNRRNKDGVFTRIILQIGVLNDYQVTRSCLETSTQSCAFPEIAFLQHDLIDPPGRFFFEKFSCSIGRSVIHNDNFQISDRCRANSFNYSFDRRLFVITRDNDGQLHLASFHRARGGGQGRSSRIFCQCHDHSSSIGFLASFPRVTLDQGQALDVLVDIV